MNTPSLSHQTPQSFWLDQLRELEGFYRWILDLTAPYIRGDVLEFGCGNGNFTYLLAERGFRVVGVDIEASFVAQAKEHLKSFANAEIQLCDATMMPWEGRFDTIVMLDVLEHIADERAILSKLKTFLRPGGQIIIKVPAFSYLFSEMDVAVGHYRRYTRSTLTKSLGNAGFTTVSQRYFNLFALPGWWWNSKVLHKATPPAAQLRLFNRLLPLLRFFERIFGPPIGLSVIAVGATK